MFSEEIELHIENFTDKGDGEAFHLKKNARVVLPHVIIGDVVRATINKKKKKGGYKGRLVEVIKRSLNRVDPLCSHTTICGGCRWQEMKYLEQLKQKEKRVLLEFEEILKTQAASFYPIIACDDPFYYRNKMEFSFSENAAKAKFLGLMIAGANKYVFNVERCFLCSFWFSDILQSVKKWWETFLSIKAYNFNNDEGVLRYLTIREGKNTNEKMVILTISGNENYLLSESEIDDFCLFVRKSLKDPENLSIFLRIQKIEKKKPTKFFERLLFGKPYIREKMKIKNKEFVFKISPSSFFQPNTHQAEKFYTKALELSKVDKNSVVFDLYCGTGTLGMAFSSFTKRVLGIELNPKSVIDAKENIRLNQIDNFEIYQGDVGKTIKELLSNKDFTCPDLVIIDPPRSGLDDLVIYHLKTLKPKKILYISCNPKTQALNVKDLMKNTKYRLNLLQPVDQFPHTVHIENIALLELA